MEWEMGLQEEYLRLIKEGKKRIEGRLYDEKRRRIKEGDIIIFEGKLRAKVKALRVYSSFKEMLKKEGIENVLPGVKNIEEGVQIYRQFYSEEREKKYGVVAIEVEPIG
ncbi:MAG: ASCH domain-containing protein [Palaeococcus sp.]|uniref:ASCH domain-containing protein n=1 Tax=Palaeococcus sp. (in: euryarchaeotes) TaxID=2820298 RepID=UPI000F136E2D|nr:ASCH domain-containing protein [Palaeococcus sp. (in: euryarchaeotes)]MCD6558910.1 ASCH domain-containing protein [Palaeococcus sp. (in: euryarchaeotes)]RLF78402.1 MAG: isomerase [Thermococci archaeon]